MGVKTIGISRISIYVPPHPNPFPEGEREFPDGNLLTIILSLTLYLPGNPYDPGTLTNPARAVKIPPGPPLLKGGSGDLNFIFYVIAYIRCATPNRKDFNRPQQR